jgi:VTC domain
MLLDDAEAVDLDTLEQRSALQRRVDRKYVVDRATAGRLARALAFDHDALEIDGERLFAYESVYFDTPQLDCFHEQVVGLVPRFKVRSRLYADSGHCSFEVKLKLRDSSTAKEHGPCEVETHGRLVPEARRFVDETLTEAGLRAPRRLDPVLVTRFSRGTLGARDGSERVTFDVGLELEHPGGGRALLRDGLVLVETKSQEGEGRADRLLAGDGVQEAALSKYRAGIALVVAPGEDSERAQGRERWFVEG